MSYYRSDLAAIHERGFAHLANAAADVLTAKLDLPQSLTRVMANCLGGRGVLRRDENEACGVGSPPREG